MPLTQHDFAVTPSGGDVTSLKVAAASFTARRDTFHVTQEAYMLTQPNCKP